MLSERLNAESLARLEGRLLGSVENREHVDPIGEDAVDDSVRCFDHLADVLAIELRNHSTRRRESRDLLRPTRQAVDHAKSVSLRVQGDVIMDGGELLLRVIRPVNSHSGRP